MKSHLLPIGTFLFHLLLLPSLGQVTRQPISGKADPQPMYMLTYDHGGLILWGSEHFQERLRNATSWLDRYPGFKIGLDNEAHMYDYLAEQDPVVLTEIREVLDHYPGRFGIGTCTYGQPLSQFICGESNIRQVGYAIRAMEDHFHLRPTIYLMSEHAMHAQIPQILNGFGFKGAIMRTHFMMYGYNPTYREPFGWWVGMDGSRIPTVPTYEGEGEEFFKTTVDNWILTRYPGADATESLADFRKQFAHIDPLLATRADDSGLRKEELVSEYEGNPDFRWILLEELLDLYPEPSAAFITRPDDFKVRMPWGYCGNRIWNTSRNAEVQLLTAERLAALECMHSGQNWEEELHNAWKNLLVAQHHDVQIVGLTGDAEKFLGNSLALSEKVMERSLDWAAVHMGAAGRQQVTVFNPLSWERNEWIRTTISFEKGEAHSITVRGGDQSTPVVYLHTDRFSDGSIFQADIAFAAGLPPSGLASYAVNPDITQVKVVETGFEVDSENLSITTPYYFVNLDPGGGIASLENRADGTQVFAPGRRSAYFCGTIEGKETVSAGRWVISKGAPDSPWVTATEYGFIADIPYTFSVTFHSQTPRIDCRAGFRFDGQRIGQLSEDERDRFSAFIHDKKLRFKCYPSLSGEVTGIKDLPFVVTETELPVLEGNYWTALANPEKGLALFNKGNMGSVRESDGGFSVPLSYAMHYIWGTRMLRGDYAYEFALFPFTGPWREADLHREAISYNFPVVHTSGTPGDGSLGEKIGLLDRIPENVVMSAMYVEGGKIYMRFYETRGIPSEPSPFLEAGGEDLIPVDLTGAPSGEPQNKIQLAPWQIRTFQLSGDRK